MHFWIQFIIAYTKLNLTLSCMILFICILSIHISQGLPKTAYYKLIDWWLMALLNLLVLTLAFHTYLAYFISKTEDGLERGDTTNDYEIRNQSHFKIKIMKFIHDYLANVFSKVAHGPKRGITNVKPFDKHEEDKITDQKLFKDKIIKQAKFLNTLGNVTFIIFLVIFNCVFWTVALMEHFKPAEYYLSMH